MYLLSIFPSELNCFLVWSEYIWFSLLCFCPSFVSWVLPRLKFPNIHPSALLKAKVFLTSLQPTPVPTVCLMASRAQGTPCWMHVAYLMASEAQLEPTQKWAIEEEVWAPPSHLNHSRKAAFRSPAERGKLSCIFAWGRRMTPQMMPVTGRSQNFQWWNLGVTSQILWPNFASPVIMYLLIWCDLKYKSSSVKYRCQNA